MRMPKAFSEFVKPSVCMHEGCNKRARWTLQMRLWAKGYSKENSVPIPMMWSIKMCDDHQYQVKPETFFVSETKRVITLALRSHGKAEPDFETAEFMWVPLGVTI